jgi:hypothetical protein
MKNLKAECYRIIQILILQKHPICQFPYCGKPSQAGHHIFPRNRMGTAFNPQAVFALCLTHHDAMHRYPVLAELVLREALREQYDELEALSRMVVQYRDEDYRKIKDILTNMLQEG